MDFSTYFKKKYQDKLLLYLQGCKEINDLKLKVYDNFDVKDMERLGKIIMKEELPLIRNLESSLKLIRKFKESYNGKLREDILDIISTFENIEYLFEKKTLFGRLKLEHILNEQAESLFKYDWKRYKKLIRKQNKFKQNLDLLTNRFESMGNFIGHLKEDRIAKLWSWYKRPVIPALGRITAILLMMFILIGSNPQIVFSQTQIAGIEQTNIQTSLKKLQNMNRNNTALVIVDLQYERSDWEEWDNEVSNIGGLAKIFKEKHMPIVVTHLNLEVFDHKEVKNLDFDAIKLKDIKYPKRYRENYVVLIPELKSIIGDYAHYVEKSTEDPFKDPRGELRSLLKKLNVEYLVIVGFNENICMKYTVGTSGDMGFITITSEETRWGSKHNKDVGWMKKEANDFYERNSVQLKFDSLIDLVEELK